MKDDKELKNTMTYQTNGYWAWCESVLTCLRKAYSNKKKRAKVLEANLWKINKFSVNIC